MPVAERVDVAKSSRSNSLMLEDIVLVDEEI